MVAVTNTIPLNPPEQDLKQCFKLKRKKGSQGKLKNHLWVVFCFLECVIFHLLNSGRIMRHIVITMKASIYLVQSYRNN